MKKNGPTKPYIVDEWNLDTIKSYSRPAENGCLEWKGGSHKLDYAMMRYQGDMRTVHSVIAQIKYGEKPTKYSGTRVTRTCDNKMCVNPDHIIIVDASSLQRGSAKVRRKFTDEQIREMRKEYDTNKYWGIVKDLAIKYKATEGHVSAIVRRHIYKGVKDET